MELWIVVLLLLEISTVAKADMFKNPVVGSDAPDPGVAVWKGTWWMVTTGLSLRSSTDLVTWTNCGTIFTPTHPPPSWATSNFWAPELHRVNGKWVCVFSASDANGNFAAGGAISESDSPAGPWNALPNKLVTHQYGVIDVHVATDNATGTHYLVYKINGDGPTVSIAASELAADGTHTVGNPVQLLVRAKPWEKTLVEAPWIVFKAGYYWLFYSGGFFNQPTYAVGVARSQKLLGPYAAAPGPVISQRADKAPDQVFSAPGHCSVVEVPETGAMVMIYHAWLSGKIDQSPGRVVLVDQVWWNKCNNENGWPCVADSGMPTAHAMPMPMSREFAGRVPELHVFTNGTKIALASFQWHDHCWNGATGTIDGSCSGNTLYVRHGNAGPGTVSLSTSATASAGPFWRHRDSKLHLDTNDGSELFKQDSSFIVGQGLQDSSLISLRPVNYPDSFIRHANGVLQISAWDGSSIMAQDATWVPIHL